jgi:hypothetical protein
VRPALLGVIAVAALLCLWDLTVSGYSNTYYAAAAKAGSESWQAWFFGALDPGSFITVVLARGVGLVHAAGSRVGPREAPRVGGGRRRPRVHDEDAAGLDGRAGARRRVRAGRAAGAAPLGFAGSSWRAP